MERMSEMPDRQAERQKMGPKGGEEAQPCWVEKKIAQCDKLT